MFSILHHQGFVCSGDGVMIVFASDTFNVNFCYDPEAFGQIHKRENFDDIPPGKKLIILNCISKTQDVACIVSSYD